VKKTPAADRYIKPRAPTDFGPAPASARLAEGLRGATGRGRIFLFVRTHLDHPRACDRAGASGLSVDGAGSGAGALALAEHAWSAILLLLIVQDWWASFGLVGREDWSFAAFAALLLQTILLYMVTALVLPDMPAKGRLDLEQHYYRQRPVFFGIALLAVASSALREWVVEGHFLQGANLAFHAAFAAVTVVALLIRRPWAHHAVAAIMGLLSISYIALLYAEL